MRKLKSNDFFCTDASIFDCHSREELININVSNTFLALYNVEMAFSIHLLGLQKTKWDFFYSFQEKIRIHSLLWTLHKFWLAFHRHIWLFFCVWRDKNASESDKNKSAWLCNQLLIWKWFSMHLSIYFMCYAFPLSLS